MPFLRLYLPEISVSRKRHLAQKLIETTIRTFELRPSDRDQITVQFLSQARPRRANCRIEVGCRDLPPANQRAFAEDVAPMLMRSLHLRAKNRLARLMGAEAEMPAKVDVRFLKLRLDDTTANEWAVGDALVADWERAA
jgi:hypothetical protein